MINIKRSLLVPTFLGAAIISSPGSAAVLEEVVVTAQKREQSQQDVGIAITAFTGEQLEALGVEESFDIAAFTPGVHTSGNLAGQNTQFTIRGVTQNDFNDVVESPNAVYLDEGYLAIAQAQTFAVFDVERVEILKGPQGTLFGRNATGGLVHYQSRKPNFEEAEGYANVTFGRFDSAANANQATVEAAYGAPLSNRFAGRVAAKVNYQDGWLNNLYPSGAPTGLGSGSPGAGAGADLGGDRTVALRSILDFQPSDNKLFRLSGNYAHSNVPTGPYQSKSTIGVVTGGELVNVIDTPAGETRLSINTAGGDAGADAIDGDGLLAGAGIGLAARPTAGGDFFGYTDPDGKGTDTSGDFAFENQGFTETLGLNGRYEWQLDNGMDFTSVTDFKQYDKLLFIDVDSAPVNQLANYAGVDAFSFTQELRLNGETDKTRWVAGLFYLKINTDSDNGLKAPANSVISGLFGGATLDIGSRAKLETDSYSVFGQLEYDLTPDLTAIIGGRIIQEEKDFEFATGVFVSQGNFTVNQGPFLPNAFGAGSPFTANLGSSDTLWTGKVQLDWHPTDDLLVYAGVNRGVKAGSFNAPLLGAFLGSGGVAGLPYNEEVLLSYETGFKSTFHDGKTRLNGSVFYYDYTDYQAFSFVGVGGNVINADAETYGLELDLQTSPFEGMDAIFSFAWTDATVKDVQLRFGSPLPRRDVRPTYTPEYQATTLLRYEWPAFGGMMHIRGDASYSSDYFYNLRNFDADKFDSYIKVNSGIGWSTVDGDVEVNFRVNNLTDEAIGVQGFDLATLCGCNEVAYQAPRWYGVNVLYQF